MLSNKGKTRLRRGIGVHDEENPFCTKNTRSDKSIPKVLGIAEEFVGFGVPRYVYIYIYM